MARQVTVARRIVHTAASIVVLAIFAGCALPLTPATVPVAVAFWGIVGVEVLSGIGTTPAPGEPEPQALMLGQICQLRPFGRLSPLVVSRFLST